MSQSSHLLNVLLIGDPHFLPQAFPDYLRMEIGKYTRILPVTFAGSEWREFHAFLEETDVILSTWGMPPLDEEFLSAAPGLSAVFYAGGSVKAIATREAYERGIHFSSAVEANAIPVAEYTLAAILFGLKGFWSSARLMKVAMFDHASARVAGVYDSKVGLVSLGSIGRRVATHLQHHEVNVLAYDPFADPDVAAEYGVTLVSLEDLFVRSHVVSIHTPWLPETEGMIDGNLVSSMPHGACLINTSRGAVIDEAELCQVLHLREDLTAVLDVTRIEPLQADSPLRALPNVVLTPHIAGSLGHEISRMGRWMVDELQRYLVGDPLRHGVSEETLARMA